jgi:uncharacterized protein (TIGR03067 family)
MMADDSSAAAAKQGAAELQGKWKLLSLEIDGTAIDLGDAQPRWVIKGNKVRYGGEELGQLIVDPTATPKIVDLSFAHPKKVYEAIYAIDQDTLKICLNKQTEGVKERPADFSTKDKKNLRLLVFQRDKTEGDEREGNRGYVGLALRWDEQRMEVNVAEVLPDSPAKAAGLQKDDVVLKIAGEAPTSLLSAIDRVRQTKPDSQLAFRVRRGEKEMDLSLKVGIMPFIWVAQLMD